MKSIQKLKHLLNQYNIVWEVTSLLLPSNIGIVSNTNLTLKLGSWKAMVQPYSKVSYRPQPRTGADQDRCLSNIFESNSESKSLLRHELLMVSWAIIFTQVVHFHSEPNSCTLLLWTLNACQPIAKLAANNTLERMRR